MKDREYWHWLETQSDIVRKNIIEKSPWYTLEKGTKVYLNVVRNERCYYVAEDGTEYTSKRVYKTIEYLWEGVNVYDYYDESRTVAKAAHNGTIKEFCENEYTNKEIEMFGRTMKNIHRTLTLQLGSSLSKPLTPFNCGVATPEEIEAGRGRCVYFHPLWICDYKCLPVCFVDTQIHYKMRPCYEYLTLEP